MTLYRTTALALAIVFAAVGAVFLLAPQGVLALFDWLSGLTGLPGMPPADAGTGLFRALAVTYMYVVTLLAWRTFRRPAEPEWPALLAHAKLASAAASFFLFVAHAGYLVYLANGIVDGLIGSLALVLRQRADSLARSPGSRADRDHERPAVAS